MQDNQVRMNRVAWLRIAVVAMLVIGVLCPSASLAQVPGRFYWKSLSGANAVPLIVESVSGNTNPFDSSHTVDPGADFEASMALAGYARTFSLLNRSAMVAVIAPMGRISGDVEAGGRTVNESARGYGDPMFEFDLNILGPPAQKNLVDAMRYEPGFSVDLLADVAAPVGEYDASEPLNLGQNRWYGRVGAPVIWQLGAWVPGRRTTIECLPAVWLFGDNDDYAGGTLSTDPLYQLDAHLTRDFTERFWGALDGVWYQGGQASVHGEQGEDLNNLAVGFTLGQQINENLSLTFGYKSTIDDSDPDDLQMDGFMVTLVTGWHPLIEGVQRLNEQP